MTYRPGDQVYPADLPRRFLCRVTAVESFTVSSRTCQMLKLEPLEGPWPTGTSLIRLNAAVVPAHRRARWTRLWSHRSAAHTAGRQPRRLARPRAVA